MVLVRRFTVIPLSLGCRSAGKNSLHNAASQDRECSLRYGFSYCRGDDCANRLVRFAVVLNGCIGVVKQVQDKLPLARTQNALILH